MFVYTLDDVLGLAFLCLLGVLALAELCWKGMRKIGSWVRGPFK